MNCSLLDVGSGLGQDVRKLRFDGVHPERIYSMELEQGLIDAGFDLFMDRGLRQENFLVGNILADDCGQWLKSIGIDDGFDIVHVGALFHLFDWDDQVIIAKNLATITRDTVDPVIFGWQFAARRAGLVFVGPNKEGRIYGHNDESIRRLWDSVGDMTGMKMHVEVRFDWTEPLKTAGLAQEGEWGEADGNGLMWFSVRRKPSA